MSYIIVSNPATGFSEIVPLDEYVPKNRKERVKDTFTWDPKRRDAMIKAQKRRRL